jgi:hypothetical protein
MSKKGIKTTEKVAAENGTGIGFQIGAAAGVIVF